MTDPPQPQDAENIPEIQEITPTNEELINEYKGDRVLIKYMQTQFKRLSRQGAMNLIEFIIKDVGIIRIENIQDKWKSLWHFNRKKFSPLKDQSGKTYYVLSLAVFKDLRTSLNGKLAELNREIIQYDKEEQEFDVNIIDGIPNFLLDKNSKYKRVRKLVGDEGGDIKFIYNFDDKKLSVSVPKSDDRLQRTNIQILRKSVKFNYPIEYDYVCIECGYTQKKKAYEGVSTKGRLTCGRQIALADGRSRRCSIKLNPDDEGGITIPAFYYDIAYDDTNNEKRNAYAISFEEYDPGFYECVFFNIPNPGKMEFFHLINIRPMQSNIFIFPIQDEKENYVFTLQRAFDKYIKHQTQQKIFGLYPIKIALIIEKLVQSIGERLISNIQIVGDASTGKTFVLKFYGFLLNGSANMSTNGQSISVAGLRGTKTAITLLGKEQSIVTLGALGSYHTIHIDEAGDNKELIQQLKTFLLEDNYSYDKAGALGTFHKRTAQVNISQNLDYEHIGQYRGAIRKAYKDDTFEIEGETKQIWNENWDLHQPIYTYDNPYLYKIIKDKRTEYQQKQQFWIDGYEFALHERFPFYFFLEIKKDQPQDELTKVVQENAASDIISENLEIIKSLKTDAINEFFCNLRKYRFSKEDIKIYPKVDQVLDQYGMITDARMKTFYYLLIRMSRVINKRMNYNEMDFNLLRWLIENTNRKLSVMDTASYTIRGPPDIEEAKKKEIKIEESTKEIEGTFGMPQDEF